MEGILAACSQNNIAAKLATSNQTNHHDDWFLPSLAESKLLLGTLQENKIQHIQKPLYISYNQSYPYNNNPSVNYSKHYWSSTQLSADKANFAYYSDFEIKSSNTSKETPTNVLLSREITSVEDPSHTCQAILYPYQFTNHIDISPVTDNYTNVWVEFLGEELIDSNYRWDFGRGQIISGSGKGPYQIKFDFGGFNLISLTIENAFCSSPIFFSEPFQVKMVDDIQAPFPPIYQGDVDMTDFNNDGFLDIIVSGSDTTQLYQNLGDSTFEHIKGPFPNLSESSCAWGDFDNDNFIDLIVSGLTPIDSIPSTKIFRNLGNNDFVEIESELPNLTNGTVDWFDNNNDGQLDIIITGDNILGVAQTRVFQGQKDGTFHEIETTLPNVSKSAIIIDDYNRDNYQDLIILGSNNGVRNTQVFKNNEGTFELLELDLVGLNNGDAAWEDIDNDGTIDFIIAGNVEDLIIDAGPPLWVSAQKSGSFQIFRNHGDDIFINEDNYCGDSSHKFCYSFASLDTGDFDNDGLSDILVSGMPRTAWIALGIGGESPTVHYRSKPNVLRNTGISFESLELNIPGTWTGNTYDHVVMPSFECSSISFQDYNSDGSIDILREGRNDEQVTAIYQNKPFNENIAPTPPTSLEAEITCDATILTWDSSVDDHTIESSINYEFYLGTSPNSGNIFSKKNNRKLRTTFFEIDSLPDGIYYWSVKGIDNAKTSSEYALEQSFEINCTTIVEDLDSTTDFLLLPNPFSKELTIQSEHINADISYNIVDQFGRSILEGSFRNFTNINSQKWEAGAYFVILSYRDKTIIKKIFHIN